MSTWRRFAGDDHVCGHEHPAGCFFAGPEHGESSAEALERAFQEGSLVTNGLVYAELAPKFETQKALDDVLEGLSLRILGVGRDVAFSAGRAWQAYRKAGGKRDRILPDFLIGAHAGSVAERLLTRDRGFYRN